MVEADESDRSMLSVQPEIVVLTNVELDHHASFASLAELREVFRGFLSGAPRAVIWNRPELLALREGEVVPYEADEVELAAGGSRFRWRGEEVRLDGPGAAQRDQRVGRARGLPPGWCRGRSGDSGACGLRRGRAPLPGARGERGGRGGLRGLRTPPDRGGRDAERGTHARPSSG